MATSGGNNSTHGQMLLSQLDRWQEMKADRYIAPNRLKVYSTVAGLPVWLGSGGLLVNVCERLDWKQALAMELWYLTSPVASIADAFDAYEAAFTGNGGGDDADRKYASKPLPEYAENDCEIEGMFVIYVKVQTH